MESVHLLLVEDNPGDVRLIREAFRETDSRVSLEAITEGSEALEFLTQECPTRSSVPDLVLLDLQLPDSDGLAILEAIREQSHLQHVPVLVLTSSRDEDDVERCYDASANAYLTKPNTPDEFVSLVEVVEKFWFDRAKLPPV